MKSQKSEGEGERIVPVQKLKTGINIGYFCFSDQNDNFLIASGENTQFILDLRDPRNYKYFGKNQIRDKNNVPEVLVEYNQNQNIIFMNRATKSVEVYDIRKEKEAILQVDFESPVQKIEFDPLNESEFIILFEEDYFVKIDFLNMKYDSYKVGKKKIWDFSFNNEIKGEFIISGNRHKDDLHTYQGFLNMNQF